MQQGITCGVNTEKRTLLYQGADKSSAQPGRKQATATKL